MTTRRFFIAATASLAVPIAPAASAITANPDAELFALGRAFEESRQVYLEATRRRAEAADAVRAMVGPTPADLVIPDTAGFETRRLGEHELSVEGDYVLMAKGERRLVFSADRIAGALEFTFGDGPRRRLMEEKKRLAEERDAAIEAAKDAVGWRAANLAHWEAMQAMCQAAEGMIDPDATTFEGCQIKAKAIMALHESNEYQRFTRRNLCDSLAEDLALVGAA